MLHAQLARPVSVLDMLYACVVPQARHAKSPSNENWPAEQLPQMMFAVVLQVELPSQTVPAAQADGLMQAAQGARPVEDQFVPSTHGRLHVLDAVFHEYPLTQPQTDWPVRPRLTPFAVGHTVQGFKTKPVALKRFAGQAKQAVLVVLVHAVLPYPGWQEGRQAKQDVEAAAVE